MIQPPNLFGFIVTLIFIGAMLDGPSRAAEHDPWQALPQGVTYDPQVPTPEQFIGEGFEMGSRHLYHHQLVAYVRALDDASPRIATEVYAHSYGQRPLVVAVVTSPQNHARLADLMTEHARWADPRQQRTETPPLPVAYVGYSVHGNEASAGNAAPLVLYHLAAAQGAEWEQYLERTIVLIDPCLNPDGFDRFAHWVNNHRGLTANPDPLHIEHHEGWTTGRTNYYWFDLNRDWLPSQHPESQGRLTLFRKWMPNLVLDFHEMGTHSTYFFQPGVPSRKHPLIPASNVELTDRIAAYHAAAFDQVGALYYTEETFDDFYPGKGSTYADLHGAVGILFEQASSRGVVQNSPNGELSFAFTVRNQVLTSMSSLRALDDLRDPLLQHQRQFYEEALGPAAQHQSRAYLFSAPKDPVRRAEFARLLDRHGITSYPLRADITANSIVFSRDDSLVVPSLQPERRFLEALVERRTIFEDSVFYDVSAWSAPLAFDLIQTEMAANIDEIADTAARIESPAFTFELQPDDVAIVIDWHGYLAPRVLYELLKNDVLVKAATHPFSVDGPAGSTTFDPGAIVVPLGLQPEKRTLVAELVKTAGSRDGVRVMGIRSALTREGADLGSAKFIKVEKPRVALVIGEGVRPSEAGEVWHLLDRRFSIPLTLIDVHEVGGADLDSYNVIVLVSGQYAALAASSRDRLKAWVEGGGTLISIGRACELVAEQKWADIRVKGKPAAPTERLPYAQAQDDAARQRIGGAILHANVDITHPLAFGLRSSLPLMRDHAISLEVSTDPYSTPLIYSSKPLLSGYVSSENLDAVAESAAVIARPMGNGRVVVLADNPNFRGYWYGSNRLFLNAIFYGPLIRATAGDDSHEH